jgi:uncharacterized coiled-coil protein SlyX
MVEKSSYNKKNWLLIHAALIQSLKQNGMTNKQIIDHLKTKQKMPFALDESLFSRHCRTILEQLDLEKTNAVLISKVQSLEKYNYYLEGSNKSLVLQNHELSKPKPVEQQPVISVNNEHISDLKDRLAQKQQGLDQLHGILEQQKTTIQELQAKLANIPEKSSNEPLNQKNIALKRDIRRLESILSDNDYATSLLEEKLNAAQMRAKQSMYLAYSFLAISILFLLVIVF